MTSSELAILALGLLLGAASGAALVVTFGSRPTRREIRVTVTRDAVPRRSETLSQDAFLAGAAGPAPGGPGDRREVDREVARPPDTTAPWRPAMQPLRASERTPNPVAAPAADRTLVPSFSAAVAIAIEPETDRELHDLRPRPTHGSRLD